MAIVFSLQLKGKADGREDPDSNDGRWEGWQIETATIADGREDSDGSDGRRSIDTIDYVTGIGNT